MKATDIRVETVEVTFDDERLSVPLHLSKGVIEVITYATVTVRARTRGGAAVQGTGAILLSDVWAFPAPDLTHEEKDRLMRRLCRAIADWLQDDPYDDPHRKGDQVGTGPRSNWLCNWPTKSLSCRARRCRGWPCSTAWLPSTPPFTTPGARPCRYRSTPHTHQHI